MIEAVEAALSSGGWPAVIAVAVHAVVNILGSWKRLRRIEQQLIRLELLDLINHAPNKRDRILEKFDEYKNIGGNSYMDLLIEEWKEKHGNE